MKNYDEDAKLTLINLLQQVWRLGTLAEAGVELGIAASDLQGIIE